MAWAGLELPFLSLQSVGTLQTKATGATINFLVRAINLPNPGWYKGSCGHLEPREPAVRQLGHFTRS